MSLIERLMNLAPDGLSPAPKHYDDPQNSKIAVHEFFAAQSEVINTDLTIAQVKTYYEMDQVAQDEYDALVTLAPTGTNAGAIAAKALYLNNLHSKLILAEKRVPGYSTPAELRAKLGLQ